MQKYIQAVKSPRRKVMLQSFGQGMHAGIDKRVLPVNIAKEIFNFDFSTGALTQGFGLTGVPYVRRKISNIWTYKRYDIDKKLDEEILMYADADGYVYYLRHEQEHKLGDIKFTSTPAAVNYRLFGDDVILLTSSSDYMVVWDAKSPPYAVENSPHITSMTIHFERMFCTVGGERNAVWFSQDLDPTNWDLELDRGGFIQVLDERGKLNKVISYLNFVYILRDFGISRVSAFADQVDFSVSNLFVSSGHIYSSTATLCGDRILFLASDGLYQFDGLITSRIMTQIDTIIAPSPNSIAHFHNGKYYLSCHIDENEATVGVLEQCDNNAVLVYDLHSGSFSILKGACVRAFSKRGELLYAVTSEGALAVIEQTGELFGEPTIKSWSSGFLDFGSEQVKHVREVYLSSDMPLELKIYSERNEKTFNIVPVDEVTRIRVNLSGRKIGITIKCKTSRARISRPTIVFT